MQRLAIAALALSACATDDLRPRNLEYITEAVLAPSCGAAECHSTFTQADSFAFDTVAASRATFQADRELVESVGDSNDTPGLVLNLTLEQPDSPRMPYAAPLSDVDVELIESWLKFGAPGVCLGSTACLGSLVVPCHDVDTITNPDTNKPYNEKGAYRLDMVGTAVNCATSNQRCVNGACQ